MNCETLYTDTTCLECQIQACGSHMIFEHVSQHRQNNTSRLQSPTAHLPHTDSPISPISLSPTKQHLTHVLYNGFTLSKLYPCCPTFRISYVLADFVAQLMFSTSFSCCPTIVSPSCVVILGDCSYRAALFEPIRIATRDVKQFNGWMPRFMVDSESQQKAATEEKVFYNKWHGLRLCNESNRARFKWGWLGKVRCIWIRIIIRGGVRDKNTTLPSTSTKANEINSSNFQETIRKRWFDGNSRSFILKNRFYIWEGGVYTHYHGKAKIPVWYAGTSLMLRPGGIHTLHTCKNKYLLKGTRTRS